MPAQFAVILPAAGKSSRFNDPNLKKPFISLDGRPVWMHSAERFSARDDVKQILVVIAAEDEAEFKTKFGANLALLGIQVVIGGAERADSVAAAIEKVNADIDFIAIHDAARPCIADEWIDRVFREAENSARRFWQTPSPRRSNASAQASKSPKPSRATAYGKPKHRKSSRKNS